MQFCRQRLLERGSVYQLKVGFWISIRIPKTLQAQFLGTRGSCGLFDYAPESWKWSGKRPKLDRTLLNSRCFGYEDALAAVHHGRGSGIEIGEQELSSLQGNSHLL